MREPNEHDVEESDLERFEDDGGPCAPEEE